MTDPFQLFYLNPDANWQRICRVYMENDAVKLSVAAVAKSCGLSWYRSRWEREDRIDNYVSCSWQEFLQFRSLGKMKRAQLLGILIAGAAKITALGVQDLFPKAVASLPIPLPQRVDPRYYNIPLCLTRLSTRALQTARENEIKTVFELLERWDFFRLKLNNAKYIGVGTINDFDSLIAKLVDNDLCFLCKILPVNPAGQPCPVAAVRLYLKHLRPIDHESLELYFAGPKSLRQVAKELHRCVESVRQIKSKYMAFIDTVLEHYPDFNQRLIGYLRQNTTLGAFDFPSKANALIVSGFQFVIKTKIPKCNKRIDEKVQISVSLPLALVEKIDCLARIARRSRSNFITNALIELVESVEASILVPVTVLPGFRSEASF